MSLIGGLPPFAALSFSFRSAPPVNRKHKRNQPMKNTVIVIGLALGVSASFLAVQQADGQAPPTQAGSPGDLAGYHLFQPRFQESLKLNPDQQKSVSALDVDVKSKLGTILTAEQFQLLNRTHPPRRQNAPAGGQGGSAPAGPDGQSVSDRK